MNGQKRRRGKAAEERMDVEVRGKQQQDQEVDAKEFPKEAGEKEHEVHYGLK